MPSMDRHQFLAELVHGVEKYFDIGGIQASWAKGSKPAHRFWGDEDDRIEIPYTSDEHTTSDFAVSPDEKLVTVCGGLLISVYDIATKECRTQFRCPDESFPKLRFQDLARGHGGFCLIVATSDRPAMNNKLVMVELDDNGQMLTGQANILVTPNLIDESLAPIVSQVNRVYVSPNTIPLPLMDEVRAKYVRALEHLQAKLLFESFEQIDGRFSGSQASTANAAFINRQPLTAVFVGATGGIGEATVRQLCKIHGSGGPGLRIIIVGRNTIAAQRIIEECKQAAPHVEIRFVQAGDISLLRNVDQACIKVTEILKSSETAQVDMLIMSQGQSRVRRTDQ
ncbi:WD40 repeat-like protein [Aureobasidium pullulans]|nr:WD40 repeat-like protein [Aureobasidium pullulans]